MIWFTGGQRKLRCEAKSGEEREESEARLCRDFTCFGSFANVSRKTSSLKKGWGIERSFGDKGS